MNAVVYILDIYVGLSRCLYTYVYMHIHTLWSHIPTMATVLDTPNIPQIDVGNYLGLYVILLSRLSYVILVPSIGLQGWYKAGTELV